MPKPTLKQIWRYMRTDLTPVPPGPYEIALRMAAAILSSGKFGDDLTAPMELAWKCVFPFYAGQKSYLEHAGLMFHVGQHASGAEGFMSPEETRAYITGGETGDMGESGFSNFAMAVQTITPEEAATNQLRQIRISDCDQAMFAADRALQEASGAYDRRPSATSLKRARRAKTVWDAAAKAQSEAHSWTPTPVAVNDFIMKQRPN